MTNTEKNRFDYLDVLRGIAALSVCIQHICGYVYHTYGPSHPLYSYLKFIVADSVDWGRFGVVLFFLVSGFIIPNSLKPGTTLKKFFISRVFRLYPAYWAILVLIVVSSPYLGEVQSTYSFAEFIANMTMIPKLFGVNEMSGVFWTLLIEIIFYVCCSLLFQFKLLDKTYAIGFIALGLNLVAPMSIILNKYFHLGIPIQFILFHLSFLFAGNLLRLALVKKDRAAVYLSVIFIMLVMLTIPITTGLLFTVQEAAQKGFVMFKPEAVVYAYFMAIGLFIYAIYYKSFKNRLMVGVGEISYSLYLFHMVCFVFVFKFLPPETTLRSLLYFLICGVVTYAVAKFVFIKIEYPSIKLGRKIIKSHAYT